MKWAHCWRALYLRARCALARLARETKIATINIRRSSAFANILLSLLYALNPNQRYFRFHGYCLLILFMLILIYIFTFYYIVRLAGARTPNSNSELERQTRIANSNGELERRTARGNANHSHYEIYFGLHLAKFTALLLASGRVAG